MLFLVATPIGNINDCSPRVLNTLKDVDYIYAEDTRVFRKLVSILQIEVTKNIRTFNLVNENDKTLEIISLLEQEKKVAIVCDAGHPLIADPGYRLVKEVIKKKIQVVPIAGPCALILALIKSGLSTNEFTFYGFLKIGKNKQLLEEIDSVKKNKRTAIFYISKHDIERVNKVLTKEFSNYKCVIIRELTKMYETIYTGKGCEIVAKIDKSQRKGEFVLLIEGKEEKNNNENLEIDLYKIASTKTKGREKAKIISKITNKDSKEVYKKLVSI